MGMDRRGLRNLLLDCRAALRRADAGFMDTPLRAELDAAIGWLDHKLREPAVEAAATAAPAPAVAPVVGDVVAGVVGDAVAMPATAATEPEVDADAAHVQARPHARGAVPDASTLQAVLAGGRALDAGEREACVGEALVRSGFSRKAEALAAMDDAALARLLLEELPAPEWPVNSTWTRRSTR